MYSYFPIGEVNAVLGINNSSKWILWYPAHRSNMETYFDLFNLEKNILYIWHGQINFHVTLLSAQ